MGDGEPYTLSDLAERRRYVESRAARDLDGVSAGGSFDHMVEYHAGAGTWWAECADFPGFTAAADTRDELTCLVAEFLHEMRGPNVRWYSFTTTFSDLP